MSSKPDSEVSHRKFADRLERQANDGHGWNKVPDMLRESSKRIRDLEEENLRLKRLLKTFGVDERIALAVGYEFRSEPGVSNGD